MTEMALPGTLKVKVGGVSVPVPFFSMPPGVMAMWPTANPPAGWLLCQGQSLVVAEHSSLHAVIGYTYGGSGANFNLPDLRVRIPVGAGTGKALASSDGLAEGSRNAEHSHSHSHTASGSSSTSISGGISGAPTGASVVAGGDHVHNYNPPETNIQSNTQTGGGANRMTGIGTTNWAGNHGHGFSDPWHAHGHTIGASTSTTVTVNAGDPGAHPFLAVNYIIKE